MDIKGHPKKPLERDELPLAALVEAFRAQTREEDPGLAKYLDDLDAAGQQELGGVLGRFDQHGRGELEPGQRLLARRILGRLHRPGTASLEITNRILDYLDLNRNALIEENELELGVEVFELFARADSDNDTLSELELKMLYAVLRHIDTNDNGALDANERDRLRQGLDNAEAFLAQQKATTPLLKELLAGR